MLQNPIWNATKSSSKQVLSSSWKLIPKLFCCSYALRWVSSDGRGLVTEHIVSHLLCITLWASLCVLNAAYKNPVTSYIFVTANHHRTHKKWMDLEAVLLAPKSSTVFTTFWAWICLFSLRVTEQILVQFSKLQRGAQKVKTSCIWWLSSEENFWWLCWLRYETEILIVCFAALGRVLYGLVSETCHLRTECLSQLIFYRLLKGRAKKCCLILLWRKMFLQKLF